MNAVTRAKTNECKAEIEHVACYYEQIAKKLDQYDMVRLGSRCPAANRIAHDTVLCLLTLATLKGLIDKYSLKHQVLTKSRRLTHSLCNDICYTHFGYSFVAFHYDQSQYKQHMCVCLKNLTDPDVVSGQSKSCLTSDSSDTFQLYRTKFYSSVFSFFLSLYKLFDETFFFYDLVLNTDLVKPYEKSSNRSESLGKYSLLKQQKPSTLHRIVFFFTLNKRTHYRQIIRLLKTIYDQSNFYYIHMDPVRKSNLIFVLF